jgi:hypothetical protein
MCQLLSAVWQPTRTKQPQQQQQLWSVDGGGGSSNQRDWVINTTGLMLTRRAFLGLVNYFYQEELSCLPLKPAYDTRCRFRKKQINRGTYHFFSS